MTEQPFDHRTSAMLRTLLKSKIDHVLFDCLIMLEVERSIFHKIAIAYDDKIWASSNDGTLVFNMALALMPLKTVKSVLLHELVHLVTGDEHDDAFCDTLLNVDSSAGKVSRELSKITPRSFISTSGV